MADICDSCAFEDACPSAHFNKTAMSFCAFYKGMGKGFPDGTYWKREIKDEAVEMVMERVEEMRDETETD